jgi:GH15 family glucan-1,4-alpha-glucosidase
MNQKDRLLVNEARKRALDILHRCVTPSGFRASADAAGYPQIWGRDSIFTLLGALASGDTDLLTAGKNSLETIGNA